MGKVRIACRHAGGLMIRLFKVGWDDGTGSGVKPMVPDGPGIRLNGPSTIGTGINSMDRHDLEPGITIIDQGWWEQWFKQNKDHNPMLAMGLIYMIDEVQEPAASPLQTIKPPQV